ncbi:Na+/H+ antiporter subunit E [Kribbella sp. WER1]
MARRAGTAGALIVWGLLVWTALTWTVTVEFVIVGVVLSVLVTWAMAGLGPVVRPWRILVPRTLWAAIRLAVFVAVRVLLANLSLARRIWSPSLPLATGMVIVRTRFSDAGRVGAVGIVSSLIVDNQIVDVDLSRRELVYHCIAVPREGQRYDRINGPLERRIAALTGDRDG